MDILDIKGNIFYIFIPHFYTLVSLPPPDSTPNPSYRHKNPQPQPFQAALEPTSPKSLIHNLSFIMGNEQSTDRASTASKDRHGQPQKPKYLTTENCTIRDGQHRESYCNRHRKRCPDAMNSRTICPYCREWRETEQKAAKEAEKRRIKDETAARVWPSRKVNRRRADRIISLNDTIVLTPL
jgi:hypothetical protein